MRTTTLRVVATLMLAMAAGGCGTYYRVTDPASGKK